jgi:hypothetical protein
MQSAEHRRPVESVADRNRPAAAKAVGGFVPQLVREALRRRGFNNIDVVLRWREIVGPALAAETWPLRIEWPRRQETVLRPDGTADPGGQRTRLVVGAAPARALDVEYAKRDIVERVNRYLGYRAATELAATPDYSVGPEEVRRPATAVAPQAGEAAPTDDPLKAALARLGQGVARRGF